MLAAILWTLFAIYGCGIQAFNLRWALYKWRLVAGMENATAEQVLTTVAHARVNLVRTFVVLVNLAIGITSIAVRFQQTKNGTVPAATLYGLFFTIGFLANEFGWDVAVTLEVVGRRKLRRLR